MWERKGVCEGRREGVMWHIDGKNNDTLQLLYSAHVCHAHLHVTLHLRPKKLLKAKQIIDLNLLDVGWLNKQRWQLHAYIYLMSIKPDTSVYSIMFNHLCINQRVI